MSTGSAALTSASKGTKLFFCPYPACFGSTAALGAARKEGDVLANVRRPPPVLPAQIRRESVRGGGEEEEVDRDHVSVPSVPPVPSPQRCTNPAVKPDWVILVFNPDLQN